LALRGVLAPCLRSTLAQAYGHYSKGSGQVGGMGPSSPSRTEQLRAPDGRACERHLRGVEHRTYQGTRVIAMDGMEHISAVRFRTSGSGVTGASCL
jgi:hypothetical protein